MIPFSCGTSSVGTEVSLDRSVESPPPGGSDTSSPVGGSSLKCSSTSVLGPSKVIFIKIDIKYN